MPKYLVTFDEGNTSGPFDVYLSGSFGLSLYEAGVTKSELIVGYVIDFPNGIPSSSAIFENVSFGCSNEYVLPFPTPTPSISPSISITPSRTPSRSITPTITLSITPSRTPSLTRTPSISITPSITPSTTPSLSIGGTPTPTPSTTVTRTPTPTPGPTLSITRTPTITPSSTSPLTGNCQFIFVPDSLDTTGYGLRYNLGGEINTLFGSLFSTPITYGGIAGQIYSVCSTLQPLYWEQSTNTTISYPSGVIYLGTGTTCTSNIDCTYVEPTPTPTPSLTKTPSITPSITPSPSPFGFYGYLVAYDENSESTACAATNSFVVYSLCSPVVQGGDCELYYSYNTSDIVSGGYYADQVSGNYYYVEDDVVQEVGSCNTPPPSPSPLPACYGNSIYASTTFDVNELCNGTPRTVYLNTNDLDTATISYGTSTNCSTVQSGTRYYAKPGSSFYYVWNGSSFTGPTLLNCP